MKTERISNLSLTTITRFAKEQLIEKAKENVEFFRERLDLMPQSQHVALSLHLAEITLASLEAGPVVTFYRDGIEAAATWVDKQRDVYDSEHGRHDPDTGFFEFGNDTQRDYSTTLEEIAEGIRGLHPNTAPPASVPMKDHQIRELVNKLRGIAVKYHGTQQLRERIAQTVRAAMLAAAPQQEVERVPKK